MFIDSHCHLDCIKLDEFNNDMDLLIATCAKAGVKEMLCVSINLNDYPAMLSLIEKYPQVHVSVGVHPMADEDEELTESVLHQYAESSRVIAIGETGLDYYYHKGDRQWQQDRFIQHIHCAKKFNKPVIVHTRDAGDDTLEILKEEGAEQCGGIIHCFTETKEFAQKVLDLGFMISFSGIVTFKNAEALREVAKIIPDDQLLIETDSPYLAPIPHRGKQNNPSYVVHVAQELATLRNTTVEHIAEITARNFYRLFSLD